MNFKIAHRILLYGVLLWCIAIVLPPFFSSLHFNQGKFFVNVFFSRICHQIDSHSLHLFGIQLAVCARCSAIYFSFFIGVITYKKSSVIPFLQSRNFEFPKIFLFLVPMVLDVLLNKIGLNIPYANERRIITGILFGFPFSLVLTPVFTQSLVEMFSKKEKFNPPILILDSYEAK